VSWTSPISTSLRGILDTDCSTLQLVPFSLQLDTVDTTLPNNSGNMSSSSLYGEGDLVLSQFNPGIVAASYLASLCGCLLTIELLHRRGTALGNLRSW